MCVPQHSANTLCTQEGEEMTSIALIPVTVALFYIAFILERIHTELKKMNEKK